MLQMLISRHWLLALALCLTAGGLRGQIQQKAQTSTTAQSQATTPECSDAVECATQCEKGIGASCYKLGGMYRYGTSGAGKNSTRALDFYLKACDRGVAQGCNDAGVATLTSGNPADMPRAIELYKKGCTAGSPYACGNLGVLYEEGRGVTQNIPQAIDLLNTACAKQVSPSCVTLGKIYELGETGKKDAGRALTFLAQACDEGNGAGCYHVGLLYLNGAATGVAKDPKLAVPMFKRGCGAGSGDSCGQLGWLYESGEAVEKDDSHAASLYQEACDKNAGWACRSLALMYQSGRGVQGDLVHVAELFQKGCDLGHGPSCNDLGVAYENGRGVLKDQAKTLALYQKACDAKIYTSCTNLGLMYRDGVGVAKDPAVGVREFTLACDGGDPRGCFSLGYALNMGWGIPKDLPRAAVLYQKACDAHYPMACGDLAFLYRDGSGVPKDEKRAFQLFTTACDTGDLNGCSSLGFAYEYARGTAMDEAKAAMLYQKACQGSIAQGCDNYKRLTAENRSLAPGLNAASVPATAPVGAVPATVTTRSGAPATEQVKSERWALVVGISKYKVTDIQRLRFARKDAEAFYNFLLSPIGGGFRPDHVRLLRDEEATNEAVRGGVRDFLGRARKDDLVEMYFAGHGAPDPLHPNALYLLTYDTVPDRLGGTAFDMGDIHSALQKTINAERVIVYVDACHSGGISTVGQRAVPALSAMNRYLQILAQSNPVVAMFSSTEENELSQEGEQWGGGHGAFTYYLLQGLQGAADRDNDGVVTIREMADYVSQQVSAATDGKQHPRFTPSPNWEANFPVSVLRGQTP
jgi:uncharacterized protein